MTIAYYRWLARQFDEQAKHCETNARFDWSWRIAEHLGWAFRARRAATICRVRIAKLATEARRGA